MNARLEAITLRQLRALDAVAEARSITGAAQALGLGSVWLGTWPQMERVERQRALLSLPDTVIPHSILAFGYPDEEKLANPPAPPKPKDMPELPEDMPAPPPMEKSAYESDRIHMDRW